jgi:hypothetical protein
MEAAPKTAKAKGAVGIREQAVASRLAEFAEEQFLGTEKRWSGSGRFGAGTNFAFLSKQKRLKMPVKAANYL